MSRKERYTEDEYEEDEQLNDAQEPEEEQPLPSTEDLDEMAENDVTYAIRVIQLLRNQIAGAKGAFMNGNSAIVDREKCLRMLSDLEKALPLAVRRGEWVYKRNSDMLEQAKEQVRRHIASEEIYFKKMLEKRKQKMEDEENEAKARVQQMLDEATRTADNMVRDGVIESRVEDEVRAIRSKANAEARDIILRAEDESYKQLDAVSVTMDKMLREINRMRDALAEEE